MIRIENIDCLELLKTLPDNSIDLMLQDPPYNTTQCAWEYELNLPEMWEQWKRVLKDNGVCLIFSNEPFTSKLITSNLAMFKYKWIWCKDAASGFLNASKMPLMGFEEICLFSRAKMGNHTYNPQITNKAKNLVRPRHFGDKVMTGTYGKHKHKNKETDPNKAYPINVLRIGKNEAECNSLNRVHPTQKPIDLMRYLIRTYSNPGDAVFDGYSGSGTVADACMMEGRSCIAAELNKEYYDYSIKRLAKRRAKPELFTPTQAAI